MQLIAKSAGVTARVCRTMKAFETSSAALAALCIAGIPSHAKASSVTVTLDLGYNEHVFIPSDIAIDSTIPQFVYDSYLGGKFNECCDANFGTLSSGLIASSGINGVGAIDPALTYSPSGFLVSDKGALQGSGFVQLAFLNSRDQEEFGFASFDGSGDLLSITYQPAVTATPLPKSWLLLISGLGAIGLATRRRRRVAPMPA
jgi:hypothetical protein